LEHDGEGLYRELMMENIVKRWRSGTIDEDCCDTKIEVRSRDNGDYVDNLYIESEREMNISGDSSESVKVLWLTASENCRVGCGTLALSFDETGFLNVCRLSLSCRAW
ncbi:unnamed protein product, partial [Vicia faba]